MILLVVILFFLWIYILTVLTRAKLYFFKFIFGSVGVFFFAMFFLEPYVLKPLSNAVTAIAGIPGELLGLYEAYPKYSLIFITRNSTFISFYIDYECSGLIEIFAFSALLWFFPVYDTAEKAIITLVGIAWIFFANVMRILIICTIIYYAGNNMFYFAHTIFGRIVFYCLSIVLYFYVFTKAQVIRQKVGQFSYANFVNKSN